MSDNSSNNTFNLSLINVVALAFALFQLYTAGFGYFPNIIQRSIHLGFVLFLAYGTITVTKTEPSKEAISFRIIDYICMVTAVVITIYIVTHYWRIIMFPGQSVIADRILGVLLIVLLLEASRRTMGWIFPILTASMLFYAVAGPLFPGLLGHRGLGFKILIESLFMTTHGMWGTVTAISATIIATFVIFGTVLLYTGGGKTFIDFSILIAGRARGGGAKMATVASSLFGTISGNGPANVATTGSFTIPMMIHIGYARAFAAAVESVASSGGQILPPIMGAGAFIMAELVGVPYLTIVVAATIPAILFYVSVWFSIDFEVRKRGYGRVEEKDIPKLKDIIPLKRSAPLFIPLIVFIYLLLQGYTPDRCAFYALVLAIVLFLVFSDSFGDLKKRFLTLLYALQQGGKALVGVAVLAVCAQVIVSLITLTGLGIKLTEILVGITGHSLLLSLILAMFICIILGMGTPTVAAYILASTVVSPALIRLGLEPITANLFVFYFAVFSAITPPVCACVYIGASIAKSNWLTTAKIALQLGVGAFYIPFLFVFLDGLLMRGDVMTIILDTMVAIVGVIAIAAGLAGCIIYKLNLWERILLMGGSILILFPGHLGDIIGFVFLAFVVIRQIINSKKDVVIDSYEHSAVEE